MNTMQLIEELNIKNYPIGIKLEKKLLDEEVISKRQGCILRFLDDVSNGEKRVIELSNSGCPGANRGCGFVDGIPNIQGGFGYFLSYGRGEGYPKGEKVKKNPDIAIKMIEHQPENVLEENKFIVMKPYKEEIDVETVAFIVNSDQMAALIHLYNFEDFKYDNVIAPMCSGCASIFRIPFDEAKKENPRAVIGNVDIFSRPIFPKNTFIFVVPHKRYLDMLKNADESFLYSHIWNKTKKRLFEE